MGHVKKEAVIGVFKIFNAVNLLFFSFLQNMLSEYLVHHNKD